MHRRSVAAPFSIVHTTAVLGVVILVGTAACCGGAQPPLPEQPDGVSDGTAGPAHPDSSSTVEPTLTDRTPLDPAAARAQSLAVVERAALTGRAEAVRKHVDWALIDAHTINDLTVPTGLTADIGDLLVATAGGLLLVDSGFIVDRLTVLEGLPANAVRSVHLDDRGVLWLAFTEGGCRRLTGGELHGCPDELAGEHVADWAELGGDLYALTWEGLLWRLERPASPAGSSDPGPVVVESVTPGARPLPFSHRLVACDDRLWVGTLGSGLAVFDPAGAADGGTAWVVDDSQRVVEDLACQGRTTFAGGPGGLVAYAPAGSGASGPVTERRRAIALGGGRQRVTALAVAEEGLYAGIADGSVRLFGDQDDHFDLPGPVSRLAVGGQTLWAGGDAGLFAIDRGESHSLSVLELPGPGSTDVTALASFDDRLVLGLFRAGLAIWGRAGWLRLGQLNGLPSDEVNALAFDASGRLWVGTSGGLARIAWVEGEPSVQPLAGASLPCHHINAVTALPPSPDGDEQVVAASSCGVFFVDADSLALNAVESRPEGLPHRIVYTVTTWNDRLVAGTNDGLAVRDGSDPDRPWTTFRAGRTALVDNWITAVATSPDGGLAVGTYSGGFYRGAGPESLARLEGPRYINPSALLVRGTDLFVGGLSEGAYWVVGDTVHRLTASDCILGDDVTAFTVWRGDLLVATRSGVARLPAHCAPAD